MMKVYMDRTLCTQWQASCESCFGNRLINDNFILEGCVLDVIEDDSTDYTFHIKDRDGEDKVLLVNEDNWPEAYESWMLLLESQQSLN